MSRHARPGIEAYLDRLYAYAVSLAGDPERAADLVQDTAVRALAAWRQPRDEAAYRAWLFRILRNRFLDCCRQEARTTGLEDPGEGEDAVVVDWDLADRLLDALTVRLGLAKVSPAHREILTLVDMVGLSYAEASAVLEAPQGTVMSRLARARRALLAAIAGGNVRALPRRAK